MKTIYLIGFMGSGKSTVGAHLSELLQVRFRDLDTQVEKEQKKTISQIFKTEGERAFRQYESAVLREVQPENFVISTGGGIVEDQNNVDWMRQTGVIIYLKTSFSTIENRLRYDKKRPLWNQDIQKKMNLFQKRSGLYQASADVIINTDNNSAVTVANDICEKI